MHVDSPLCLSWGTEVICFKSLICKLCVQYVFPLLAAPRVLWKTDENGSPDLLTTTTALSKERGQ